MSIPQFRNGPPYPWYTSYVLALFEDETNFIAERINTAEQELADRESALFNSPESAQERKAIVAALHALAALRTCYGFHGESLE